MPDPDINAILASTQLTYVVDPNKIGPGTFLPPLLTLAQLEQQTE